MLRIQHNQLDKVKLCLKGYHLHSKQLMFWQSLLIHIEVDLGLLLFAPAILISFTSSNLVIGVRLSGGRCVSHDITQ